MKLARCALVSSLCLGVGCGGAGALADEETTAVTTSLMSQDQPAPQPAPKKERGYSAAQFYETTTFAGASFSHDEKRLLITSDETGVSNAYSLDIATGQRTALTSSTTNSLRSVSFFPQDDRFLVSADQGGNELNHLYVYQDGKAKDLTPGDKTKASFAGWSRDKKSFFVMTNERDPKYFDLYEYEAEDYKRALVFRNDKWEVSGVSKSGRWVVLAKNHNNADSDLYLWDRRRPKRKPLLFTKHKGTVKHTLAGFSVDEKTLYFGTDAAGEFVQIWSYGLRNRKKAKFQEAAWDIGRVAHSETGKYRLVTTNADARTEMSITDLQSGQAVALKGLPPGDIGSARFSRSEKTLAFYLASDRTSRDLFVADLASGQTKRLTRSMNPAIDSNKLVDGQVIRYKSFDGLDIPAILYRPTDASATAKVPATLFVHGGPGGQSRLGYRALIQYLVNHGYAVLAVNNRGSSGYGKTFFHLDDQKHGDVDLKDCVWGKKYLQGLDWIDGERIAITGGSYGGFMVLAALAFTPDEFAAGIDIFGVSNWLRTLKSIPPWWQSFRDLLYAEMGDPKTDEARLRKISPLFSASSIKKPLLVVQGANDPRVLKVESDEIVAAVRKNNVPVEYLVFPDEGHGFRKRNNRIRSAEVMRQFLDKHLGVK